MLRHAGVTDSVLLQQPAIDERVFRMDVKDPLAKFVDVRDRVDELADQMARIPFQAEVLAWAFIKQPFPERGLPEHVVMHNREVIWPLRAMLESNPDSALLREFRQRFPER